MIYDPLFDDSSACAAILAPIPATELQWRTQRLSGYASGASFVARVPVLTEPQITYLLRQYHCATYLKLPTTIVQARNLLLASNTHVAASAASHCTHLRVPFDDAVSIGYLSLYHAIDRFDYRRPSKFSSYAFQGACWAIFSQHRRNVAVERRLQSGAMDNPSQTTDNSSERQELRTLVQQAVKELSEDEQAVVHDLWWRDDTVKGSAARRGLSPKTVQRRKASALQILRVRLGEQYGDCV